MFDVKTDLPLLCDFYELTMGNGYLKSDLKDTFVYFDVFFRKIPDNGGYAVSCGLRHIIEYLENLNFDDTAIEYLKSKNIFSNEFLEYLKNFKFECDVYAVPDGTVVFPNEPLVTVRGPVIQAQLIETMLLLCINHQSLIATKASRIVRAAAGRPVVEFGARRAHGESAAVYGALSAYIAGCEGTSCTLADLKFSVPALGTMAHSWVQMFDSEYEAFKAYAQAYPDNCSLLVDTYNVLKSGIPNAIKVFNEVVLPKGYRPKSIRIDSGDITYLSKKARKMLDEAGFEDCKIMASNSLDEYIIRDTLTQGAQIDLFGVGERLVTAKSEAVFGGVYKLCAIEKDNKVIPKIKISENVSKITTPHFKKVYRLYSKETNKALADYICVHDEEIDSTKPLEIFDPIYTWKRTVLKDYKAVPLMEKIFEKGKLVYNQPDVEENRRYCKQQLDSMWDEVLRFENPHGYYVDLSQKLWEIKNELLSKMS